MFHCDFWKVKIMSLTFNKTRFDGIKALKKRPPSDVSSHSYKKKGIIQATVRTREAAKSQAADVLQS